MQSPNPSREIQIHIFILQHETTPQSLAVTLLDLTTTKTSNLEDPLINQGDESNQDLFHDSISDLLSFIDDMFKET